MGQRGGPTCRVSGHNTLLEDGWCLSGSGSCQVDEGCGLLAPSAPPLYCIAKTTKRQRWLLRSSGYVLSLLLRASCKAALANLPARRLGWPSQVRGETRVASTASWAPFQSGKPLAMTSVRRSSYWWRWLMLTSSSLGVCSDSGAGFHTDASSCSFQRPPTAAEDPDWAQAARCSQRGFRMRQHRQVQEVKGSGSRRRRRRITMKSSFHASLHFAPPKKKNLLKY